MNYVFKNGKQEWEPLRLFTFKKFEDGIYYRDAVLETNAKIQMNLADIPLLNGILRVDKNSSSEAVSMRLGHYALPQFEKEITTTTKKIEGKTVTIMDNGKYQLAMIPLLGWDKTEVVTAKGLHPESQISKVIDVADDFNPNNKSSIYATLMLWKKSGEKWEKKELNPIKILEQTNETVTIQFTNGIKKIVDFNKK